MPETVERLDVAGATLSVGVHGPPTGLPVLLLHAFPLSRRMWDPQVEALGRRYRLLVPDLRGLGESGHDGFPFMLERWVDDVVAVLDALETRPVVAVGLSMGGYVALRLHERERRRVHGLVLADTRAAADDDQGRLRRSAAVEVLRAGDLGSYAHQVGPSLLGPTTRRSRPDLVERVERLILANDPDGIAAAQVAMAARTDTTESLPDVGVPSLVLVGEEDGVTTPAACATLARSIPGGRLSVLTGAGHLSNLEAADAFNEALLTYLDGLPLPQAT